MKCSACASLSQFMRCTMFAGRIPSMVVAFWSCLPVCPLLGELMSGAPISQSVIALCTKASPQVMMGFRGALVLR